MKKQLLMFGFFVLLISLIIPGCGRQNTTATRSLIATATIPLFTTTNPTDIISQSTVENYQIFGAAWDQDNPT
jgi:hypothetical protein